MLKLKIFRFSSSFNLIVNSVVFFLLCVSICTCILVAEATAVGNEQHRVGTEVKVMPGKHR